MSFLSPPAFGVVTLTLPLVLLYFLKVRRRERRVPSLFLWDPSLRDREASAFFQRLQRDPLLILQILALVALSLALARPAVTLMGDGARKVVVVLDTSASMKARDVSPSRFDVARAEAAQLVGRLSEGAEVMVIETGVQPKVAAALGRDRQRALAAIGQAQARDLPNRLVEAVRAARALVGADPRAEIHVFTDGAFSLSHAEALADPRIHWVGVGRRSRNVGITSLAIRRSYFGSSDYQAFVALVNYSPEPQTFTFALELDGRKIAEKDVTLEPSVRRSVVLPFSHSGGGIVTARLQIDDDLAVDDVAYAVLPPPRKINVLLVSTGNLFLEKVLRTDPQVSLEIRTPDQYQGGMAEADVAVLDSVTPPRVGPGRFVFVNAVPPDVPLEVQAGGGPADSPSGRARRDERERDDPARPRRQGPGDPRDGELHRHRRGRRLHPVEREGRDAGRGQFDGRRGIESSATPPAGVLRPSRGGAGARADPARALAAVRAHRRAPARRRRAALPAAADRGDAPGARGRRGPLGAGTPGRARPRPLPDPRAPRR